MATAVQLPAPPANFGDIDRPVATSALPEAALPSKPGDVRTELNFYKPNEDGSPPHPTYVDRPETYDRPIETHPVTVHDITGDAARYTLDGNGFQLHTHESAEKDFIDDEHIKAVYYPETEQLLKDV